MSSQTKALLAIAFCFAASAAIRSVEVAADMGVQLRPALTAVEAVLAPAPLPKLEPEPEPKPAWRTQRTETPAWLKPQRIEAAVEVTRVAKSAPESVMPGGDLNDFVRSLKTRSDELDAFKTALDERAGRLEEAEKRIDAKIEKVAAVRAELESLVETVEGAQQKDIVHLAAMYSRMKPKSAGEIFNTMDVRFAAEFLSRMKPDVAALIMANMDAPRAYETSLVLAGRNKDAARAAGDLKR